MIIVYAIYTNRQTFGKLCTEKKRRGFIAKPKRSGGDRLAHSHAKKWDGEEKEEEGGRWRIALTNCTHSSFSRVFSIAVKRERRFSPLWNDHVYRVFDVTRLSVVLFQRSHHNIFL